MVNAKDFFSGNWLRAEDCKGGEICEITADAEITEIPSEGGETKEVMNIPVKIGELEKIYTPNKSNGKILIGAFGEETKNWVGKKFKITLAKAVVFGKLKDSIIVEPLPTQ